jgi:orotidine-5'-phosphate decarboxylase
MALAPRDRLAVPLDVPSLARAEQLIEALAGVPGWLKVGLELFTAAGPAALEAAARRANVFLDLKLHDIPNTVAAAVRTATAGGVGMLTLHAAGGRAMLAAARDAAADEAARRGAARPALVAVTLLTSLGEADLAPLGIAGGVEAQVARLVDLAQAVGLDGVVASAREAAWIRRRVDRDFRIVTPGIRGAADPPDDQTRTASAAEAAAAGSDVLVVGRPIVRAQNPAAAARAVIAEIEKGLAVRQV